MILMMVNIFIQQNTESYISQNSDTITLENINTVRSQSPYIGRIINPLTTNPLLNLTCMGEIPNNWFVTSMICPTNTVTS